MLKFSTLYRLRDGKYENHKFDQLPIVKYQMYLDPPDKHRYYLGEVCNLYVNSALRELDYSEYDLSLAVDTLAQRNCYLEVCLEGNIDLASIYELSEIFKKLSLRTLRWKVSEDIEINLAMFQAIAECKSIYHVYLYMSNIELPLLLPLLLKQQNIKAIYLFTESMAISIEDIDTGLSVTIEDKAIDTSVDYTANPTMRKIILDLMSEYKLVNVNLQYLQSIDVEYILELLAINTLEKLFIHGNVAAGTLKKITAAVLLNENLQKLSLVSDRLSQQEWLEFRSELESSTNSTLIGIGYLYNPLMVSLFDDVLSEEIRMARKWQQHLSLR